MKLQLLQGKPAADGRKFFEPFKRWRNPFWK